jgi:hypothetical protein
MTDKLDNVALIADGYTTAPPQTEVIRTALDGGSGRYRSDIIGGTTLVNVTWMVDGGGYQFLWSFFRNRTSRGADAFLIDLVIEAPDLTEYTAHFIPGTFHLASVVADIYIVTAQLEVEAVDADDLYDSSVVDVWHGSGGQPNIYLNLFAPILAAWPAA